MERLLVDAAREGRDLLLSAVNAGEIWYCVARRFSPAEAAEAVAEIASADCFAAALARANGAPLATGDPEIRLRAEDIDIPWLGDTD